MCRLRAVAVGWSCVMWLTAIVLGSPPALGEDVWIGPRDDAREERASGLSVADPVLPLRPPPDAATKKRAPATAADEKLPPYDEDGWLLETPWQVPTGYAGPSGVLPLESQVDSHFVPVPDRWRIGYPVWDRYGPDHSVLCPHDPFYQDAVRAR
jgi:hypothetical protein